jgi:tetratricopeptide (TPR) repeat protein
MVALIAAKAEISEEVELGRTLLGQGHLDTAQRILLKVCRADPENAEAFRVLATVLDRRGDERRSKTLIEYANELDGVRPRERQITIDEVPLKSVTPSRQNTPAAPPIPAPKPFVPPSIEQPLTLPKPSMPPSAPAPAKLAKARSGGRRRVWAIVLALLCMGMAAGGVATYSLYGRRQPRFSPREELDRALSSGTLEVLMRARDLVRTGLETGKPDPDALVRLALVNAFLAADYGVEAKKEVEKALSLSEKALETTQERRALAASARSLIALAEGDRLAAKQNANVAMTANGTDPPAIALLVSARLHNLGGDPAAAARDLDRAMGMSPELAPVLIDWAASRLDGGEPVPARRVLSAMLEKHEENSRARLVFAEAERALGEADWVKSLERACRGDTKISRSIRSACSVEAAFQARLDGDRVSALRKAKALSQNLDDPQLQGRLAVLMALLGEADAAGEMLERARRAMDTMAVPLVWADAAIRIARGESVPNSPVLEHPAGPERDLIALRIAYARGNVAGLAQALKSLPPGIQDIDSDIRAFTFLAKEDGLAKPEIQAMEKRGEKGHPVTSYVLGIMAIQNKDYKLAIRRLEKALSLHGDACSAATLYLESVKKVGRAAQPNKSLLRNLHARNAKCPLPDM